jgi:TatD DNase family protein
MLVDSHCHLNFPDFGEDLDAVVARAQGQGVGVMQTICTKMREFDAILAIAERYPPIYCSVGVHPHEADHEPMVTTEELLQKTQHDKVIGIGETGLDFFYEHSPRAEQEESFRRHITACRETQLPLIVHTRDADDDTIRIMQDEMGKGAYPGLIHCFSSGQRMADAALEMGFYISVSGIATFKKAQELRDVLKTGPLERMLVETDAPYLAPTPYRGKRNEPSYVVETNKLLAELKETDIETCAKVTTDNFFRLFSKAKRPM